MKCAATNTHTDRQQSMLLFLQSAIFVDSQTPNDDSSAFKLSILTSNSEEMRV